MDKAEMDEVLDGLRDVVLEAVSWVARGIFVLSMLGLPALAIWLAIEISARL